MLLAQLFRRRHLAMAALLTAAVLYVAALDRAVLAGNLSRAGDTAAPLGVRLAACRQADTTFFYRRTAQREITRLAEDADAPEALRQAAAGTAGFLEKLP